MASKAPRIGVIGVGIGALVYVPAFRSEGWEVAAICSRSADKAAKAARAAGIREACTDPMALVARNDLDAVAIATPPPAHHALAIAALRAGKHVLCEKPFAMNSSEAAEMRDVASESGLTAMVAHEFRFAPQRAYIKDLLSLDFVGRPQLCTIELFLDRYATREPRPASWMAYESEGGGVLGALGSHYIDGLRHWFGDVATASGHLAVLRPDLIDPATKAAARADADDTFVFTLTFASGVVATMVASFAATPARGAKIVVMGDRGTLAAEQPGPNPMENGVVFASRDGAPLQPLPTPPRYTPFSDDRDHRLMAFRLLVREFAKGIAERASPSPNFTDGLRCRQVLDAVRESSRAGRTIALD
jgi:predicted dehydrogenase